MGRVGRRQFLIAVGALLAAPLIAYGQGTGVTGVGLLSLFPPKMDAHLVVALKKRMAELGWIEGKTVAYEMRRADGQRERLPGLAVELLGSPVSVIFAGGDLPTQALKKAGGATPIVFAVVNDPVAQGLVESLARPGGTITGVSTLSAVGMVGKRLELLKEVVPGAMRVGILATKHRLLDAFLAEQAAAAKSLELETTIYKVTTAAEIEAAITSMATEKIQAGLVGPGQLLWKQRELIGTLSLRNRIPFVAGTSEYARVGCLVAYSPSNVGQVVRAAEIVDKILRGASPADIPIERPTRFSLVVNLKTAKALGLTIPQSIRLRADRVIE